MEGLWRTTLDKDEQPRKGSYLERVQNHFSGNKSISWEKFGEYTRHLENIKSASDSVQDQVQNNKSYGEMKDFFTGLMDFSSKSNSVEEEAAQASVFDMFMNEFKKDK